MSYLRVIPRDLFNEAKLLKCLGWLALKVIDEEVPTKISIDFDPYGFNVDQDESDGSISIINMHVLINDNIMHFTTALNSRDNFPLYMYDPQTEDDIRVFNEIGEWHADFLEWCNDQ